LKKLRDVDKIRVLLCLLPLIITFSVPAFRNDLLYYTLHDHRNIEWNRARDCPIIDAPADITLRTTTTDRNANNFGEDNDIFERDGNMYYWLNVSRNGTIITNNLSISVILFNIYEYSTENKVTIYSDISKVDMDENDEKFVLNFTYDSNIGIYKARTPIKNYNKLHQHIFYITYNTSYGVMEEGSPIVLKNSGHNTHVPKYLHKPLLLVVILVFLQLIYLPIKLKKKNERLIEEIVRTQKKEINKTRNTGDIDKDLQKTLRKHNKILDKLE